MAKKIDQYYVWKFKSEKRFKDNNFNIQISFEEAKNSDPKELVLVADNQFLRTIRKITEDYSKFIPYYVIVQFSSKEHYRKLYKSGLVINGKKYKRLSCSSSQARNQTIVFCDESIIEQVKEKINNSRDKTKALIPSKFNAYFGLSGSGTYIVKEPRFVVVDDYESDTSFRANRIYQNDDKNLDDDVVEEDVTVSFNRFDGMGLISPKMAETWARDIGLDYTPSQFIIRQSFMKGMLCVFDFKDFCDKVNGGKYEITDIYGDTKQLDDCDVILTRSQFKLWDSYKNTDHYIKCCKDNDLDWGVTQYSKKRDNDVVTMNYQFIQTLNLDQSNIENLCSQFIEWVKGVSYENIAYTLLFLMGVNNTEYSIKEFFKSKDNHWIKALAAKPDLIEDSHIRQRISRLLYKKVKNGCMGEIIVDGNYQFMVADPYALMQYICNLPITGLLGCSEFYSNYWNNKGINYVDAMRAPLTDRSEHVLLNLIQNDDTEYWYRHIKSGIILNVFGNETLRFAGSDFDGDLVCTTSNQTIIDGVYRDELPVYYKPEVETKAEKLIIDTDDKILYEADLFSFGSLIGQITNKSTNGYALLPELTDEEEIKLVKSRLKQCCKAQALQIDKTKTGEAVKGIPQAWDNLKNSPYFFRYRYYNKNLIMGKYEQRFKDLAEIICDKSLFDLRSIEYEDLEDKQITLIDTFYENMPLLDSKSVMNILCKYIESFRIQLKSTMSKNDFSGYQLYKTDKPYTDELFQLVKVEFNKYKAAIHKKLKLYDYAEQEFQQSNSDKSNEIEIDSEKFKEILHDICEDEETLVNILVDICYRDNPSNKKGLLWNCYGDIIFKNLMKNINNGNVIEIPLPDNNGEILYLRRRYAMKEVNLDN